MVDTKITDKQILDDLANWSVAHKNSGLRFIELFTGLITFYWENSQTNDLIVKFVNGLSEHKRYQAKVVSMVPAFTACPLIPVKDNEGNPVAGFYALNTDKVAKADAKATTKEQALAALKALKDSKIASILDYARETNSNSKGWKYQSAVKKFNKQVSTFIVESILSYPGVSQIEVIEDLINKLEALKKDQGIAQQIEDAKKAKAA